MVQSIDIYCEIIVAIAAPLTPIPNAKIKIGSKTIFVIAPKSKVPIAIFGLPSDLITEFKTKPKIAAGTPKFI